MSKGLVSIITVNYNGWQDTCELIASLKQFETYPFEIIVVDNASAGDDIERISALFPDIKLVCSPRNVGFAGGNNLGYAQAIGDFVFFLNNDMLIQRPILHRLVTRLQDKAIGGVSPMIRYIRNGEIQYEGRRMLGMVTLKYKEKSSLKKKAIQNEAAKETEVLHGGAMMVRRDVIERAGTMSEIFFLFAEEFDWSYQITEAGYKLWYEADVVVYHKGGASIGYGTPSRAYYMSRARLLFTRRRNKWPIRFLSCIYLVCVSMPKNVVSALLGNNWMVASALIRGTWHGLIDNKN